MAMPRGGGPTSPACPTTTFSDTYQQRRKSQHNTIQDGQVTISRGGLLCCLLLSSLLYNYGVCWRFGGEFFSYSRVRKTSTSFPFCLWLPLRPSKSLPSTSITPFAPAIHRQPLRFSPAALFSKPIMPQMVDRPPNRFVLLLLVLVPRLTVRTTGGAGAGAA